MRFTILSPIHPYRGGIAQFSGMLYTELVKKGHEIKVFNFKRLHPDILFPGKTQYVETGDRAIEIESARVLDNVNPVSYFSTANTIHSYASDVLIVSYWMFSFVPGYARVANQMKKHCGVITLIRNTIPHEPCLFNKPLASLLLKQCHGFIVTNDSIRYDLWKLYPSAKYTRSLRPLCNHFGSKINKGEACRKLGIHPSEENLLFFELIRDYERLDLLIEMMGQLNEDYHLIIAGECYGSFEKYQALIDASPAKERIFVHCEYISDEEVPICFLAADVLMLPYRSATQSGVVSVAYNYDLPALSTPVSDLKNNIEKPDAGIVVPEISTTVLAQGIEEFFTPLQQAIIPVNISREKAALLWEALTRELPDFINSGFIWLWRRGVLRLHNQPEFVSLFAF